MRFLILLSFGLILPMACNDDPNTIDCGAGEQVDVDGENFCVFKQSVVIENGFECPPEVPFLTSGDGFGVCGQRGELPTELIEVIGEKFEPRDPNNSANNTNNPTNNPTNNQSNSATNNATNNTTNNATNTSSNGSNNSELCASNEECAAGQVCINGACVIE